MKISACLACLGIALIVATVLLRLDHLERRMNKQESATTNHVFQIRQLQLYGDKVGACLNTQADEICSLNRNDKQLQDWLVDVENTDSNLWEHISRQQGEINECARGLANLILLSHTNGTNATAWMEGGTLNLLIPVFPEAPASTNHGLKKL